MSDYQIIIDPDKYSQVVDHLKKIAKPSGAWNNDDVIYRDNVIQHCIEHAEEALIILCGEESE